VLFNFFADIRYSLRSLLKRPGFAAVVVTTLAVGIGINVAMYSVWETALVRPLPVRDPGALVNLAAPGPKPGSTSCNIAGPCTDIFSYPMFRDLERVQEPFVDIAAHRILDSNFAFNGRSRSGDAMFVSGSYFELLGVQPALGRLLGRQDDRVDGTADAVVLGHNYWRDDLGADLGVLGQTLVVNGTPLTVVGVAPEGFFGTSNGATPEIFVPITFRWLDRPFSQPDHTDRRNYWVYLFARLKPGVTAEQAAVAINAPYSGIINEIEAPLQGGLSEQTLAQFRAKTITVSPGARGQTLIGAAEVPLTLLLVATLAVLLIACINIANLVMARGAQRIGEMAVRSSMGASHGRLAALLLTESVELALVAAAASLPIALATLYGMSTIMPAFAAESFDTRLNGRMVVFAVAVALVCAALFSLFPVLKVARSAPAEVLRAHSARTRGSRSADRFRSTLVTGQIALSMTLLVMAGLLAQSLANALRADVGMRIESLVAFSISPELNGYTSERARALFDGLEEDLAGLPGVVAASSSVVRLLAGNEWNNRVAVEGFNADPDTNTDAHFNFVGSGFFRTLGMTLIAGREFADTDTVDRPDVAIVNRRFVERYGLGDDAVGKRVGVFDSGLTIEIVGVVSDAKYDDVKAAVEPQLFRPRRQAERLGQMTFYVRGQGDTTTLAIGIRELVARYDPALPVSNLLEMSGQIRENVFLDRFTGLLAAAMAVVATLLAALGLYGVLSYTVAQRTGEIGLRMALGAAPARLRGMVLRQVGRLGLVGGALGLVAAVLLGRAARALLFGVTALDPLVLSAAAIVLAAVVLGASYLPARRASRVDPMVALRTE
jgi:predicted permease